MLKKKYITRKFSGILCGKCADYAEKMLDYAEIGAPSKACMYIHLLGLSNVQDVS